MRGGPFPEPGPFWVIPAVDLLDGRVVRLRGGDFSQVLVYDDDPVARARSFAQQGAPRLHVVDLNGAREGRPVHLETLRRIARESGVPVQFGGGLRDLKRIEQALQAGAASVIVGTRALEPQLVEQALLRFGADRVWVALDVKDGRIAVAGWQELAEASPEGAARQLAALGVRTALVTDAGRDGLFAGPNLDVPRRVAACGLDVVVAGGIASAQDVEAAARAARDADREAERGGLGAHRPPDGTKRPGRLVGVVVGRALYEGRLDLPEALARVRQVLG